MRLLVLSLLLATASAHAATLSGRSADGRAFDLQKQRGRVVMVHYWSSDCAPCRVQLPELRANLRGWMDKPFDLVSVSFDARESDWRAFEQLQTTTQPDAVRRALSLWRLAKDTRDSLIEGRPAKLPVTLVIDTEGKVVQRYEGRVPAEAWDAVAELLP